MEEPSIKILSPTKLVGMPMKMSLAEDRTPKLWRSFMPRRKETPSIVGDHLISMQVYDNAIPFLDIKPETPFTKWAVVPVAEYPDVPEGMENYFLEGGLYAVFLYRGLPQNFPETFKHIFFDWLPASEYELDRREHFERLPEGYDPQDPESEEEIWIPVIKMS